MTLDGRDVTRAAARQRIGCVPQDDIIHLDLPLRRTVAYAARLRLAAATSRADIEEAVDRVLDELDLAERGDVRVRDLSGGQRKRASIAVELLTRPQVLLLDEPTSGLDPATAAEVMRVLRTVASHGTTVIVTTHAPADVRMCDSLVLLARGGRLAFDGSPTDAQAWFGVTISTTCTPPSPDGSRRKRPIASRRSLEHARHREPTSKSRSRLRARVWPVRAASC